MMEAVLGIIRRVECELVCWELGFIMEVVFCRRALVCSVASSFGPHILDHRLPSQAKAGPAFLGNVPNQPS